MLVETALKMQCGTVWRSWKEQLRFASGESRGNKHTTRQPSKHKGSKTHSLSLTCCFFIPTAFILHKQAAPIHLLKVPLSNHIFQKHFQLRPNFSHELWSQGSPSNQKQGPSNLSSQIPGTTNTNISALWSASQPAEQLRLKDSGYKSVCLSIKTGYDSITQAAPIDSNREKYERYSKLRS